MTLLYLWLSSPNAALKRVAQRVSEGGHDIPTDVVVRRYWKGLSNMRRLYLPLADVASIYDNSDGALTLIAERKPVSGFKIYDESRWAMIEGATP